MLVAEQNERISFLKLYEKLNKLLEERVEMGLIKEDYICATDDKT